MAIKKPGNAFKLEIETLEPGYRYKGCVIFGTDRKISWDYDCGKHFIEQTVQSPEGLVRIGKGHGLAAGKHEGLQKEIYTEILWHYFTRDEVKIDALVCKGEGTVDGKLGPLYVGQCTLTDYRTSRICTFKLHFASSVERGKKYIDSSIELKQEQNVLFCAVLSQFILQNICTMEEKEAEIAKRAIHCHTTKEKIS